MQTDFPDIALRSAAVYIFMVLALRFFGKKELSQLSVTDLVLILLISNAVQNAMVGPDVSLPGGLTAALVLFVISYVLKLLMYRSPKLKEVIEGGAVMLVYKGQVLEENLKDEKITLDELDAVVREHGVATVGDVELAILETDGNISVLSKQLNDQSFHARRHKQLHPKHQRNAN